jgi:anti-sigma factor RsiW
MIPYLGCQGARDMLEPFVDGELPVSEQVALEAHLRWCDTCRARVEDIRLIGSALRLGSDASAAD